MRLEVIRPQKYPNGNKWVVLVAGETSEVPQPYANAFLSNGSCKHVKSKKKADK